MDHQRLDFLTGDDSDDYDLADLTDVDIPHHDQHERDRLASDLVDELFDEEAGEIEDLLTAVLVQQVLDDDPPEVWQAIQRMLAQGLERPAVLSQILVALRSALQHTIGPMDEAEASEQAGGLAKAMTVHLLKSLDALPLPMPSEALSIAERLAHDAPGISLERLEAQLVAEMGIGADATAVVVESWLGNVFDSMIDTSLLHLLADDRVVAARTLWEGRTYTRQLSAADLALDALIVSTDLAPLATLDLPLNTADGDPIELAPVEDGQWCLAGPDGWISDRAEGTVLACRVERDVLLLDELDAAPAVDQSLVAAVSSAYTREISEVVDLPVSIGELLASLIVDEPNWFTRAEAPLIDLIETAGLVERLGQVAEHDEVFDRAERIRRDQQAIQQLSGDDEGIDLLRRALSIMRRVHDASDDEVRDALDAMADETVFALVVDVVLAETDPDAELLGRDAAGRFLHLARQGTPLAVAHTWAALVEERFGDSGTGLTHLEAAVRADGHLVQAVDRLAHYRSVSGDAPAAIRLWRRIEASGRAQVDIDVLEPHARPDAADLGRNDLCWCDSGRKYKTCHLGVTSLGPLPERSFWLYRKACAHLERRGAEPSDVLADLAFERSGADEPDLQAIIGALSDPLVYDVALHEIGWFNRFLDEMGPLLPDDEALLAQTWPLADRSVWEVTAVEPGATIAAVDLRTGDEVMLHEQNLSTQVTVGSLWCWRALPDGEVHQIFGGAFPVRPGTERSLFAILDESDVHELMHWRAALDAPPTITTVEGDPLMECRIVVSVASLKNSPSELRSWMDENFEREEDDRWVKAIELDEERSRSLATFEIDADAGQLTVSTMSEPRLEDALDDLAAGLGSFEILSETRKPLKASAGAESGSSGPSPPQPDLDDETRELMEAFRSKHEEQWVDESIPALGGMTPRQAAADPVARENLIRLIDSFGEPSPGQFGTRPSRLRGLLGL